MAEAETRPGGISAGLLDMAFHAFTAGMHAVALACGTILCVVAVLIVLKLRHVQPIGMAQAVESKQP